jgi:hypothetical protein
MQLNGLRVLKWRSGQVLVQDALTSLGGILVGRAQGSYRAPGDVRMPVR